MSLSQSLYSTFLNRDVTLSIILPDGYNAAQVYPLLLFNDGQDFDALNLEATLLSLQFNHAIAPAVTVGIHANYDRISEYGIASQADYAGRGDKAGLTTAFVLNELLPYLRQHYRLSEERVTYAGFSLGGLMALDAAWCHPEVFSKVGVFSGALWWRQKAMDEGYRDTDRIMHAEIRNAGVKPDLKFWFQCGTLDEYDDRDGDGVIDSIQDTLECISELERKSYKWNKDVFYTEVVEGRHNAETWGLILPAFLEWVAKH